MSNIYFLSRMYAKSSHTHTTHTHQGSFGVLKFCGLRGEGRRGWEGRLKNGVRTKHMITVDQI